MLEFMQQIESGERISLFKALKEALVFDLLKVIPISAIWAIIWFLILLLKAMTSKRRGERRAEPSIRDAARTLGGASSGPTSLIGLGLNMFGKLVRMTVFLTLPAIAWENKGPFSSIAHAFRIIKQHLYSYLRHTL